MISRTDGVGDVQLSVEELAAAVAEARSRGTYVTGHAMNGDAVRLGLAAGLECFEHLPVLDEETADLVAGAGACFVSTLTVAQLMASEWQSWGVPEEALPRLAGLVASGRRSLAIAHGRGLAVGSGSDLLGRGQDRRGLEVSLMAQVVGPMAAIGIAARGNAAVLRRSGDLGTVEVDRLADLVAVDGDPLADPDLFDDPSRVVYVVKEGVVVKRS